MTTLAIFTLAACKGTAVGLARGEVRRFIISTGLLGAAVVELLNVGWLEVPLVTLALANPNKFLKKERAPHSLHVALQCFMTTSG
jgi:hypothetical protein